MANPGSILFIVVLFFNVIVFPYEVFWVVKLLRNRDKVIIQKRRPRLLLAVTVSFWIFSFSMLIIGGAIRDGIQSDLGIDSTSYKVVTMINTVMTMPLYVHYVVSVSTGSVNIPFFSLWCNVLGHTFRFYVMYHDIRRNAAIASNEWKAIITPTASVSEQFFVQNYKYGSGKYLRRYCFAYAIILTFIMALNALLQFMDSKVTLLLVFEYIMIGVIWIGSIIICLVIACTLPADEDNIGMREEVKYTIRLIMLIFVGIIIYFISLAVLGDSDVQTIVYLTLMLLLRVGYMFLHLKQTRWPVTHFKSIIEGEHCDEKMLALAHQNTLMSLEIHQTALQRSDNADNAENGNGGDSKTGTKDTANADFVESAKDPDEPTHIATESVRSDSVHGIIASGSGAQMLMRQTLKNMEIFDFFMQYVTHSVILFVL